MSRVVLDAIAADVALLERVVPESSAELGYGTDLSCVSDLAEDLAEVDPESPRAIAEALIRRCTTPRGGLPDDPNYGIDLRAHCNRGVTRDELRDLASALRSEARKDDRIEDLEVTITEPARGELAVSMHITPALARESFALTFRVSADTAILEALGA